MYCGSCINRNEETGLCEVLQRQVDMNDAKCAEYQGEDDLEDDGSGDEDIEEDDDFDDEESDDDEDFDDEEDYEDDDYDEESDDYDEEAF